jgi:hypothetical protein
MRPESAPPSGSSISTGDGSVAGQQGMSEPRAPAPAATTDLQAAQAPLAPRGAPSVIAVVPVVVEAPVASVAAATGSLSAGSTNPSFVSALVSPGGDSASPADAAVRSGREDSATTHVAHEVAEATGEAGSAPMLGAIPDGELPQDPHGAQDGPAAADNTPPTEGLRATSEALAVAAHQAVLGSPHEPEVAPVKKGEGKKLLLVPIRRSFMVRTVLWDTVLCTAI